MSDKTASTAGVNVQVLLRCRPATQAEVSNKVPQVIRCNEAAREVTLYQHVGGKALGRTFHFDKVFGPDTSQHRLYAQAIHPIVEEVLEGFNCTIFAYGQTGTGKTFTMEGGERSSNDTANLETNTAGVIPRAINHIFQSLEQTNTDYTVKCSFLELYNEETTDLLAVGAPQHQGHDPAKLRIMEDRGGVVIHGLEEIAVRSERDIYTLLDRGSSQRKTAETLLNKQSSRSHSVFIITVHMRELNDGEEVIKTGKLYLVDLAGSENISRSGAVDVRAKEAGLINKSLLTLGRVITALVESSGHVPYRDSKLTRLLRDSLGGKTKTCIIATIAPTVHCAEETLSTLDYAHRAKNIRNRPEVNRKVSKTAHIKELTGEIERLKEELHATREKNGVYIPNDAYYSREAEHKHLKDKVQQLETELQHIHYNNSLELQDLRSELEDGAAQLEGLRGQLEEAHEALRLARQGIEERDFLIATHERSEEALAEHAVSLSGELQHAANDIGALFTTVAAAHRQHKVNSEAVRALRGAVDRRTAELQKRASAAVEGQVKGAEEAAAALAVLAAGQRAGLVAVQEQLAALRSAVRGALEGGRDDVWALQERLAKGTSDVKELHSAYAAQLIQAATAATHVLQDAEQQLSACMQQQQQQLEAYRTQHVEAIQAATAANAALVDAAVAGLQRVGQAGVEGLTAAADGLAQQAEHVKEADAALTASLAEQAQQLQTRIASLLAEHAEQTRATLGGCLAGVGEGLAARGGGLRAVASELDGAVAAAAEGVREAGRDAQDGASRVGELGAGYCREARDGLDACREAGLALRAAADAERLAAGKLLDSHTAAMEASLDGTAAAIDTAAEAAAARLDSGASEVVAVQEGLQRLVEAGATQTDECTASVTQALSKATDALQGFQGEHASTLTRLAADAAVHADETYQHEAATDNAPPERTINVPPRSWVVDMRTPAPEVVLAEFHRQKSLLAAAGALLHNEGRLEGRLDGAEKRGSKENTDSNGAVEVGAEGGVTSRIPKLLRGLTNAAKGGSPKM